MSLPVVFHNEHEFLGVAHSCGRHEDSAAAIEDPSYGFDKRIFALLSRCASGDPEGGFCDETVDFDVSWYGGWDEMAICLSAVVACEKDVEASYLNQVHASPKNVAGWVRCETYAIVGVGGVEADGLNHGQGGQNVLLGVELADVAVSAGC